MSWGKKSKGESAATATAGEDHQTTYIDRGCEMAGELRFRESVRIDGHIEGEIRCDKTVVVGEEATIRANIFAANTVIHGSVEGDVAVSGETTLHKTACVTGELKTGGIVVERGAQLRGCILIGTVESDGETRPADPLFAGEAREGADFGLGETTQVPVAK